jgi:dihydropyrimidine dehydrogenase (NAD+) subunit PreA
MLGLNNIELITDRPLEVNLKEIRDCKRKYPKNALIISLMVESKREAWHEIAKKVEDTGADGVELNFGCPHGMSERGMGSAMGQVPEYTCMVTEWVKEATSLPVIVKLTPNVTSITPPARAAVRGGADAISLINTINSVMGVDLETMIPHPNVNGMAAHGGYCGPAVKPIALNMVSELARDAEVGIPISGIGGISTWGDAAEFLLLGATTVQVCTAVMHYGYRIVEDLIDGLSNYLDEKNFKSVNDIIGRSVRRVTDWSNLDLAYKTVARIDHKICIQCNLCHIACEDGAHQCIPFTEIEGKRFPIVDESECVGCNLCYLVCPSPGCISMVRVDDGSRSFTWRELTARQPETMTGD